MKYLYTLSACILFSVINAQIINFPDANFKSKLISANTTNQTAGNTVIDINGDGEIQENEATQVTYLFLNESGISDLSGIEYFINLQYLFVSNNSLDSLDLSALTQLTVLQCTFNNLDELDFTGLTALTDFNVAYNNLTNLDVSFLPNLKFVYCPHNFISDLDLSNNPIERLKCSYNNLLSLNINNGTIQDFITQPGLNDCWQLGNPNLTSICVDESEAAAVQGHLDNCDPSVTPVLLTDCNLGSENFASNEVSVFPNPAKERLFISSGSMLQQIEICDASGRMVYSKKIDGPNAVIDTSGFESGMYFLKVDGGGKSLVKKFVKE